jgi:D-lactate dehydrogenase (cytochrome)
MMKIGLANEGTSSGEHGIGNGKREYLEVELGIDAVDTMRQLKMAVDPKCILNPDKVFRTDPNEAK